MTAPTYPHDVWRCVERDGEEIEVLVEYAVDERGTPVTGTHNCPPEHYDPGSGWSFAINEIAITADGATGVTLTQPELDAIHTYLEENHEDDDGYYEEDY